MRILLMITCLLTGFVAFGQKAKKEQTVDCILNLPKGSSHLIQITHAKTKTETGKSPVSSSLTYAARLTMVDSSADELTFRWVYELPDKEGNNPAALAMQALEGFEIVYKTDEMGSFKELVDWQKVRDFYVRLFTESLPKAEQDSTNEVLTKTTALFSTKEVVESALIKEIQLLHTLHGRQYSTKKESAQTSLPTPLTESPVPAVVTVQVTSIQKENYTIETTQSINQKAALTMFLQIFKKMGVDGLLAEKEATKALSSFQISDRSIFTIKKATGLPIRAVFTRTGGSADARQVESYTLTSE